MGDMEEDIDELFTRRPGFLFAATVTAVFTVIAAAAWGLVALVFNAGPLFCSENDELITRPPASAFIPEVAACVIAVLLLAAILQAAVGWRWALALSASSVGSLLGYLTLAHYASHANQPHAYQCGAPNPGGGVPAFVAPVLLAVYALVVLSCRSSRRRGRSAAA